MMYPTHILTVDRHFGNLLSLNPFNLLLSCYSVACIRPCMASALLFRGRLEEASSCILHRASASHVKDSSTRDGRSSRMESDTDIDTRASPNLIITVLKRIQGPHISVLDPVLPPSQPSLALAADIKALAYPHRRGMVYCIACLLVEDVDWTVA